MMLILSATALSCPVLLDCIFRPLCSRALERVSLDTRLAAALHAPALSLSLRGVLYLLLSVFLVSLVVLITGSVFVTLVVLTLSTLLYALVQFLKLRILGEPLVWSDLCLLREMCLKPSFYFAYVPLYVYGIVTLTGIALPVLLLSLTSLITVDVGTGKAAFSAPGLRLEALFTLCFTLPALLLTLRYVARTHSVLTCGKDREQISRALSYHATLDGLRLGVTLSLILQLGELIFLRREYLKLGESLSQGALSFSSLPVTEAESRAQGRELASVLLVQAESLVNLEELDSALAGDRHQESRDVDPEARAALSLTREVESMASLQGRLAIDYTGAYTMRSEFSVLTGLNRYALGIYAYDPYQLVRRFKVSSLASLYRKAGYRTLCIHPNAAAFFNRATVLRNLGFERFIALEDLPLLERHGPHISDKALLNYARDLVASAGERLFLFVITMEAHGPWLKGRFKDAPRLTARECYARHVKSLYTGLKFVVASGITAFVYGDHLPPLPETRGLKRLPLPEVLAFNLPTPVSAACAQDGGQEGFSASLLSPAALYREVAGMVAVDARPSFSGGAHA